MALLRDWQELLWIAGELAAIAVFAVLCHAVILLLIRRLGQLKQTRMEKVLFRCFEQPVAWLVPLGVIWWIVPSWPATPDFALEANLLRHLVLLAIIACFSWILFEITRAVEGWIADRYRLGAEETLAARKIRTQIVVLRRIAIMLILFVTVAAALMTFPSIWHLGMGLLASAGLAGLAAGAAARPMLSNILAGIQIAFMDLIHVDDIVFVDGLWGRIEEIGTTNVYIRLGDLRRLIVPLSFFIENSFQDWSRTQTDLAGFVFLYVDFTAPVEDLRRELSAILAATPLWNGRTSVLQVTNISERTIELRATVSADDAEKCWDLSCVVREELMAFLNEHHPECLPRFRAEIPSGR